MRSILGLLLSFVPTLALAATPTLTFTSQFDLKVITLDTSPQDLLWQTIPVTGYVDGHGDSPVGYEVWVNGLATTITAVAPDGATFTLDYPIGSAPPEFWPEGEVYPPENAVYREYRVSGEAIIEPLIAELRDPATEQVLSVAKISLINNRAGYVQPYFLGRVLDEVDVQLTEHGLNRLEPVLLGILPHPDVETLDTSLTTAAVALPTESHVPASRTCELVTDTANLDYASLAEFRSSLNEAKAAWQVFRGIRRAAQKTPNFATAAAYAAALVTACVQHSPTDEDFEICVERVDTNPTTMAAGDVTAIDLSLNGTPPGVIESDVELGPIDGTVDVSLRDLRFRWRSGPPTCVIRPQSVIPDATVEANAMLLAWSTCFDTEIDADSAVSVAPAGFSLGVSPIDAVWHDILAEVPPVFDFVQPEVDPLRDTCAEPWITGAVRTALQNRIGDLEDAVGDAWHEDAPLTRNAEALDLVTSAIELGTTPICGIDLTMEHVVASAVQDESLRFRWSFESHPSDPVFESPFTMYSQPLESHTSHNGRGEDGEPFDLSYRVTTGVLNQLLRARATNELIGLVLEPTWGELGVGVPPGADADDPAKLSGTTLRKLLPGEPIGKRDRFSFHVIPHMAPFTYMSNDQPDVGRARVSYQIGSLTVLVRFEPAAGGSFDILGFEVDMYDRDLEIDFGPTASSYLEIGFGDQRPLTFTLIGSLVTACPFSSFLQAPGPLGCEGELLERFQVFLEPILERQLIALLDQVPAPQIFDAAQLAPDSVYTPSTTRRWTDLQDIILYAELPDPIETMEHVVTTCEP